METRNPSPESSSGKIWKHSDLGPILEALQGLRYGSVEIFVQDSKLIQIDRKEKIRSFK